MLKTERCAFILFPAEKQALRDLAELEGGLTMAALLRRLIRAEAKKRGVWPSHMPVIRLTQTQEVHDHAD